MTYHEQTESLRTREALPSLKAMADKLIQALLTFNKKEILMNAKNISIFLLTLASCTNTYSMETYAPLPTLVEELWLNIVARCPAKYKLRETCTYFRDFASISNDDIFLQNPLVINPDILKRCVLYHADLNHTAIIKRLLNQFPDLIKPEISIPLLNYATQNENIHMIDTVLKHPDLFTPITVNVLIRALESHFLTIAKHVITADTIDLLAPIYIKIASDQDIPILEHVLSLKNNPDMLSELLLHAAGGGHIKIVKFLIERNVDVNCADKQSNTTPLFKAVSHPRILDLLLKHGADINHIASYNTILESALTQTNYFNGIQLLINKGADITTRPGHDPLLITVINGSSGEHCIQVVQLLLGKGADVNEKPNNINRYGQTPLIAAVSMRRAEILPILLAHPGIDINVKSSTGCTALDIAIRNISVITQNDYMVEVKVARCENVIKLLKEHGAKTSEELAQECQQK